MLRQALSRNKGISYFKNVRYYIFHVKTLFDDFTLIKKI